MRARKGEPGGTGSCKPLEGVRVDFMGSTFILKEAFSSDLDDSD